MLEYISISISSIALLLSGLTIWLTLLRRGNLKMTRPAVVFYGFDFSPKITPKLFLRTLLYSTSPQGNVIESMYATLTHDNHTETFSFWGYGESSKLTPGSGLFVPREGIGFNHHFVLSVHKPNYEFLEGKYTIQIYAKLVTSQTAHKLYQFDLDLPSDLADTLARHDGVLFELEPDSGKYVGHAKEQPNS